MITDIDVLKTTRWRKTIHHIPVSRGCDFCKFRARHAVHCLDDDGMYYQCHSHFDAMEQEAVA